jgi:hypothetical protein
MNEQANAMNGRELLKRAVKIGLIAAMALAVIGELSASSGPVEATSSSDGSKGGVKASLRPTAVFPLPFLFQKAQ